MGQVAFFGEFQQYSLPPPSPTVQCWMTVPKMFSTLQHWTGGKGGGRNSWQKHIFYTNKRKIVYAVHFSSLSHIILARIVETRIRTWTGEFQVWSGMITCCEMASGNAISGLINFKNFWGGGGGGACPRPPPPPSNHASCARFLCLPTHKFLGAAMQTDSQTLVHCT